MGRDDKILFLSLAFLFLVVAFGHIALGLYFSGSFYLLMAVGVAWQPIGEMFEK